MSIHISLKSFPRGSIENGQSFIQLKTCRLFGAKTLPESIVTEFGDTCLHHPGSMGEGYDVFVIKNS